ncbi:MAG: methyl-accepting chemotaxis protein, partial [Proteobacteria bacterium]
MSLRNMNIAPRALLGFSLIGLLMIVLGVFSLNQMSHIRAAGQNIENNTVPSISSLNDLTQLTLRLRVLSYRLLLNREADTQQKTVQLFEQRNQQINQAQARYEKMISSAEEQAAYDDYTRLLGQYRQLETRMKGFSASGQVDELRALLNSDMLSNSEQVNTALDKLVKINNAQTREINQQADDEYRSAFNWVVGMLIVATLLTFLSAWLLTRSIVKPIDQALIAAEAIAEGNLTQPIHAEGRDEAARLLLAMQKMQGKLRDTLQRISGSATQLASAAEELNSVTDEGARGLTQQNNEIEQAATAVN